MLGHVQSLCAWRDWQGREGVIGKQQSQSRPLTR